jgi:hypothetical protein
VISDYDMSTNSDSMDDYDTRIKHLTDLYELWQTGLDVLERYDKHSAEYETRKRDLETVLRMLRFQMEKSYRDDPYRRSIDAIGNKPENV